MVRGYFLIPSLKLYTVYLKFTKKGLKMYYKTNINNIEVIVNVIYDYSSVVLEVKNKDDIPKIQNFLREYYVSSVPILQSRDAGYLRVFENIGNLQEIIGG